MIFAEPHTAYKYVEVKDAYGTISSASSESFSCFIERNTQYRNDAGNVMEIGKGKVYTSTTSLTFDTGDKLTIDGTEYYVSRCLYATGIDGEFSHWELTYG